MDELVTTLAGVMAAEAYRGGTGYVIAGYTATALGLAGYVVYLGYRARRARIGRAAVAARAGRDDPDRER